MRAFLIEHVPVFFRYQNQADRIHSVVDQINDLLHPLFADAQIQIFAVPVPVVQLDQRKFHNDAAECRQG